MSQNQNTVTQLKTCIQEPSMPMSCWKSEILQDLTLWHKLYFWLHYTSEQLTAANGSIYKESQRTWFLHEGL